MKVLITGGAGFIGSHVAEYYANETDVERVFVIDNLSRSRLLNKNEGTQLHNWAFLESFKKIKRYKNDVRNFKFLREFFNINDIDVVVHTAGQTAVTTSLSNPLNDFENNILGSFNLLEAVRLSKLNPIMIYCSTNKVFGNNVNKCEVVESESRYDFSEKYFNGISETFPIDLCEHTPYGASKLCSDLYFQEYGHIYGINTGVFRMSCIYGTRQYGVEDQGWIAHFVISAIKGKKLKVFGNGKQVRDILYISDLVEAFDSYIKKSNSLGNEVFCIGGGSENSISLLELIHILEKKLDKKLEYDTFDWRPSDQKVYISDISKAKKLLGWEPQVNKLNGIKKLINWVQNDKLIANID
ncbi:MAG: GDP-mannose 4,6-dehydratase [Candidatus Hodarchaeota archaeon]